MDFLDHCGGDILVSLLWVADHMSQLHGRQPIPPRGQNISNILVRYVFPYSSTELRVPWVYLVGP